MKINSEKFEVMKYGPLLYMKQYTSYQTYQQTTTPTHVHDLGVTMRADKRYLMIYISKIFEGLVPTVGLKIDHRPAKCLCYIKRTKATTVRVVTFMYNSFTSNGARVQ
ncbi:hypothetical protein E2C01_058515 [Portunus trituberculatus]|uniref:Uncharacterized protein n=1 Tax=Portunus trituberculatus TaxID=210409 RepID=A0A5B7GWN3_PORTR|nr:hypothetical protein [Portunus trituberculatus]